MWANQNPRGYVEIFVDERRCPIGNIYLVVLGPGLERLGNELLILAKTVVQAYIFFGFYWKKGQCLPGIRRQTVSAGALGMAEAGA